MIDDPKFQGQVFDEQFLNLQVKQYNFYSNFTLRTFQLPQAFHFLARKNFHVVRSVQIEKFLI